LIFIFLSRGTTLLFPFIGLSLMTSGINLSPSLSREEALLHELQFRDKVKSAEYHYAVSFEFDGFFEENKLVEEFYEKICFLSKEFEFESFKLGVSWPLGVVDSAKSHLKYSIQTGLMSRIQEKMNKKMTIYYPDLEFLIDFNKKLVLVKLNPVYIKGKYCKYSREIAQTEFFCNKCRGKGCWYCQNTGHFSVDSVEQLIGSVLSPAFGAKLAILHGAGREDMDVLMLGGGRPFIAELLLPAKRTFDIKLLENKINKLHEGKISVNSLEFVTHDAVSTLKDAQHDKIYSALVHSDKKIDFSKLKLGEKMIVMQKTPTRVAKRRADLTREKEVTLVRVGVIAPQEFVLVLRTSHGTYVKEFISGDNGKTKPSISSLVGANCTCTLLDVCEICK
ncbi:MAG: tRNA pseudouridine(54/55) synthase Pus10, partial [archaeon]